jgi:sigma-B regulation protein RsbU (phosphoserine phosphatase)
MDQLFGEIAEDPHDKAFLPGILKVLQETFGDELNIGCGHLFEEQGDNWVLRAHVGEKATLDATFPVDSVTTELLNDHGGYIFDNPDESPELYAERKTENATPVAFVVSFHPVQRWIFVYCLLPGWNREEIAFMLNAVRSALNNRLRSEVALSDLEKAAEIQRSLIPARPPSFPGFDIAARMKPAEAAGGDFYDFISMTDDIMGVVVGDASGHGLPAALLVRDVIMGLRMGMGTHLRMLYTMKKLNREIHRTTYSTRFISVLYTELEKNGNLLYANAGHVPGLIINGEKVQQLEPTGMILGPIADVSLDRAFAHIPPGGILVLFTDGVTERITESGEPLETEGLIEMVQANKHLSADDLVDHIFKTALALHHESDILEDDMTVVVIKRDP